jgi:NADH-quinone oxidoreductase subunit J
MGIEAIFFYAFALLTLVGAVLTVTMRNAVHCALSLIVALAGVAGLFLLRHAEFLFAVQIILYIGGIMVLFLFVIMLVNLDSAAAERQYQRHWGVALACVAVLGGMFVMQLTRGTQSVRLAPAAPEVQAAGGNVEQLADVLFREYLLPFELVSLLLLVAIVGGVLMAKKRVS